MNNLYIDKIEQFLKKIRKNDTTNIKSQYQNEQDENTNKTGRRTIKYSYVLERKHYKTVNSLKAYFSTVMPRQFFKFNRLIKKNE